MQGFIGTARARGALAAGIALAIGAGFIGCGGGGVGVGIATLGISGIVESTGGSLAKGDEPRRGLIDRLLGVEQANAAVTGLSPVNSRIVRICQVNAAGTFTAFLHETSTGTDGKYSFGVSPDLLSATNVAVFAFDSSGVVRLRSYLHSAEVVVDPVSELVFQKLVATNVPENFTAGERANIDAAARREIVDLSGAANIAAAVSSADSQTSAVVNPLVTALQSPGSLAASASGTYGVVFAGTELGSGKINGEAGLAAVTFDGNGSAVVAATGAGDDRLFRIAGGFTTRSDTTLTEPAQTRSYAVKADGEMLFDNSHGAIVTGGAYAVLTSRDDGTTDGFRNLVVATRRAASMNLTALAGTYNSVVFDSAAAGATGTATEYIATLQTATATITAGGAFSFNVSPESVASIQLPNGPVGFSTGGLIGASGTASVTSDGQVSIALVGKSLPLSGFVSGDGSLIVLRFADIQSDESAYGIAVLLRQATVAPTLSGAYHASVFYNDISDPSSARIRTADMFGTCTIGGGGVSNLTLTGTTVTATPSTFVRGNDSASDTFTVTTDGVSGRLTITGGLGQLLLSGFASSDGKLVVLPNGKDDNGNQEGQRGLLVLVKKW